MRVEAAIQAMEDKDEWDKKTNIASHVINKCLELLAAEPKSPSPNAGRFREEIVMTIMGTRSSSA